MLGDAMGLGDCTGRSGVGTTGDADTTEDWLAKGRRMGTAGEAVERAVTAGSADGGYTLDGVDE
jgi:hypothetical protein